MPERCVGVLLAGGAARRFGGRPKGLARVEGERIADRALGALRAATSAQLVVANDASAHEWFPSARIVADRERGLGPLAGLETALTAADGASVIVLAWDMPFVPEALLRELGRLGAEGASAVVPLHGAPARAEPLCAFYASSALSRCRSLLATGERRAAALATALPHTAWIQGEALTRYGAPERVFTSVDTLDQLDALGGVRP